ncbi:MAG: M48 family metallopeptidase [Moraxellaceae bacterium]
MVDERLAIRFYDGRRSQALAAALSPLPDQHGVRVSCDGQHYDYAYQDMTLIGAVGQIRLVIELPNEARIECLSHDIPEWVYPQRAKRSQQIWRLERSPLLIVLSLVVAVAFVWSAAQYGMPFLAEKIATQLPEHSLSTLGDQAQEQLEQMTEPSQLSSARQQQLRDLYAQYFDDEQAKQIDFVKGGSLGANAFALPNGHMVLTDELVTLAKNDQQILTVMAHERGHIVLKHNLQQAISGVGISLILVWVTGDGSDLLAGIPAALLSLNYSRDFEREADQYAVTQLQAAQIPVQHFVDFLNLLAEQHGDGEDDAWALLNSHPSTPERIAAVQAMAE